MKKPKSTLLRSALLVSLAASLAGCGNGNNKNTQPPPTGGGSVTVRQEDQFGMGFAAAFRADNNSEPASVNDGDLVAVSFTSEPVNVN